MPNSRARLFHRRATALLLGLRDQTIDLDIKFDPEPRGAFEAIAQLKNSLDVNVKLAAPSDFIPVTSDWPALNGPVEHALYGFLEQKYGDDAYSRYNSLLPRMNSFAHALEWEQSKRDAVAHQT
jgi:hypothetical protein